MGGLLRSSYLKSDIQKNQRDIQLDILLNYSDSHIFFKNSHSKYILANKKGAECFGLSSPDEIVGKSTFDFFPDNSEWIDAEEKEIMETGQTKKEKLVNMKFPDGKTRWVSITKIPFYDSKGDSNLFVIYKELSGFKEDNQMFCEDNCHFQELFDKSQDGFVFADLDGKFIDFNKRYCEILGYTKQELMQKENFFNVTPKKWRNWEYREILNKKLLTEGYSGIYEKEYVRKDGSIIPIELQAYCVFDQNKNPKFYWAVVRDISERKQAKIRLNESQRQMKTLLSNLPGMAYRCRNNEKWTMQFLSKGCEHLTGYNPEELLQDKLVSYSSLIHPGDRKYVWDSIQNAINSGEPFEIEYRLIDKENNEKWVWERGKCVSYENGIPVVIEGFISDVTNQFKAKIELEESEFKYRTLFENANDSIVILKEFKIIDCNSRFCRIIQRKKERVLGQNLSDFVPELKSDSEFSKKKFKKNLTTVINGDNVNFEFMITKADGGNVFFEISCNTIYFGGNEYVLCLLHDITKRRKKEEELAEAKGFLSNLVNCAPDIVFSLDKNLRVTTWSRSAEKLTGFSKKTVLNRKIEQLKFIQNPEEIIRIVKDIIRDKHPSRHTFQIMTSDNEAKFLKFSYSKIKDKKRNYLGLLFVCNDVTNEIHSIEYLEKGNSYLIFDKSTNELLSILPVFKEKNYKTLLITRPSKKIITDMNDFQIESDILFLNEGTINYAETVEDLNQIFDKISLFLTKKDNSVIILDRLDFLLLAFCVLEFQDT